MRNVVSMGVVLLCLAVAATGEVIPEPNVNMVSGTQWPGGDPHLQRQNEGSMAYSTRRRLTLFGASNDYRTVDMLFPVNARPDGEDTGDAWIGIYKSRDGGQTWWSTLLPGFPQDTSAIGLASPLHGFQAAADPVVRAGNNGMFYMTGIVLNRDVNPLGGVFVARFIDNNHKEAGDTISYLGTSMIELGTPGQFIDKPWIGVGPGTGQCTVNGQTFAAQNVYLAYTVFVGNENNIRTKMMFARSTDCGATWGTPTKLSEGFAINQGAHIAVDPNSGSVYVVWRRFQTNNDTNAMMIAKSLDQGRTFTKASVVANINPFEQGTSTVSIRTNAYPALAIDSTGRLYLAWSQRGAGPGGDARVMLVSSTNGDTWSQPVQVDPSLARGHQFMPALSVAGGKIVVAFYDLREDHTVGIYTPILNSEERLRVPEDPDEAEVFTNYLMDAAPPPFTHLSRRHTIDVRAAQANAGIMPTFVSTRISRYTFGSRPSSPVCAALGKVSCVEQMQFNPPNFPMFRLGTVPFFGDYIDITGYASKTSTVHHIVWTDNRDVRPPADGNWAKYTPPTIVGPVTSKIDPSQSIPVCEAGFTSSRNQNIYTSRVTDGLFVAAPGGAKPVDKIQRAFPVFVQNARKTAATYRLSIPQQPPGGTASFEQFVIRTFIDVTIPARSSATRSVFVKSINAKATVAVDVTEISGGAPVPNGLQAGVVLNPDVSNPDVSNPDVSNPDVSNQDVANSEVHNPDVSNPDVSNPDVSNPDVSNPDVSNPDVSNPDVSNPDVSNPDVSNPDVSNPDVSNPDVSNPDVSNADVANGAVSDTTWDAESQANTTTGFNIKLATNNPPPAGVKTQLIINRIYKTPVARGCTLGENIHRQVIANINNPTFSSFGDLNLPPGDGEGTFWLAPGDTARITLRVYNKDDIPWDPVESITPVVISQAANTGATQPPVTLTVMTASLPDAVAGQPYTATATAIGGKPPYVWTVANAPQGLMINAATGVLSGPIMNAGDSIMTLTVTDANLPTPRTASRTLALHTASPITITTTSLPTGVAGQEYSAPLAATGGLGSKTWSVSPALPAGLALQPGGFITGVPKAANEGDYLFTATDTQSASSASKSLHLSIVGPLTITTASLPDGVAGLPYAPFTLQATGGSGPRTWAGKGVPAGMSVSTAGVLSGTPATANHYAVDFGVSDAMQQTSKNILLRVADPLTIKETTIPNAIVGQPYSTPLHANGGIAPITWSIKGPSELSIDANGVITGTFSTTNSSFVTVTVVDSAKPPQEASQQYNFEAVPPGAAAPSNVAAGFGQLVVMTATTPNPDAVSAWFQDANGRSNPGFIFLSPSTTERIFVRLPFVGDGKGSNFDLAAGPITMSILDRAGSVLASSSLTLGSKPGTPVIEGIRSLAVAPTTEDCGREMGPDTFGVITSGQGVAVSAIGIDTTGAELKFSQSGVDHIEKSPCSMSGVEIGVAPNFVVPFLASGTVDISIRTAVNGVVSDWSAPVTVSVISP